MSIVMAWPLKRSAFARLAKIAEGVTAPPPGAELLVSSRDRPVQVAQYFPAEPDRICVYGTPLSASRREVTGERHTGLVSGFQIEMVRLEVRIRVYEPGEDFDSVDRTLGDMASAVTTAVLTAELFDKGRLWLAGISQDPTALAPAPEPSVTGNALLTFTAEVFTL